MGTQAKGRIATKAHYAKWAARMAAEAHGHPSAPRRFAIDLGYNGSSAMRPHEGFAAVMDAWREERDTGLVDWGLEQVQTVGELCAETYSDKDGVTRVKDPQAAIRAGETAIRAGGGFTERVEMTGADGGPLEVQNPDVAAAVDRFAALTDAAVRAATREREEPPPS